MDQSVYRRMLAAAVSSFLIDIGVDSCEKDALEILTEMIQAFITEVGNNMKNYTELSGRSEPIVGDLVLAFIEMGFNFKDMQSCIHKSGPRTVLPTLQIQQNPKQYNMLNAGTKQPLPSYIPQHFPKFPDPHAYIRTPTHKQPIIDYESVREKAAMQKRDVEKALTKFLAKTNPTHNLFDIEEANIFPLIASKPSYPPYLSALLPQDQIFDPEDLDTDPKMQIMQQQKDHDKAKAKNLNKKEVKTEEEEEEDEVEDTTQNDSIKSVEENQTNQMIDNPYLAAAKLPPQYMDQ